jgi:hypothetical protein
LLRSSAWAIVFNSYAQFLGQSVYEGDLALEELGARFRNRKPSAPVNLGELLRLAGLGRPLHGKEVAFNEGGVDTLFQGPGGDQLAAGLAQLSQRQEIAIDGDAGFFLKLSLGGQQGVLGFGVFTFGERPCADVLPGPKGTAGVNEEELEAAGSAE